MGSSGRAAAATQPPPPIKPPAPAAATPAPAADSDGSDAIARILGRKPDTPASTAVPSAPAPAPPASGTDNKTAPKAANSPIPPERPPGRRTRIVDDEKIIRITQFDEEEAIENVINRFPDGRVEELTDYKNNIAGRATVIHPDGRTVKFYNEDYDEHWEKTVRKRTDGSRDIYRYIEINGIKKVLEYVHEDPDGTVRKIVNNHYDQQGNYLEQTVATFPDNIIERRFNDYGDVNWDRKEIEKDGVIKYLFRDGENWLEGK